MENQNTDTKKIKSGAEAPVLRYNADGCRLPIPTDRVRLNIDTPAGRLAWLESTSMLLGECKRLVELFDNLTSTDSKVSDVETLHRVKE